MLAKSIIRAGMVVISMAIPLSEMSAQEPAGSVGGRETVLQSAPDTTALRPGDMLRIEVWPRKDLSGEFVVEETGSVHLPFLGEVRAVGVSLADLRRRLRSGYADIVQNPVVTVTPVYRVGVLGAVRSPGVYQVTPASSVFDVIGMAGGFAPQAQEEDVRIVRQEEVVEMNARRALEAGLAELPEFQLESGDQILVPAGGGINFRDVLTFVQTGATIGFLIDRISRN